MTRNAFTRSIARRFKVGDVLTDGKSVSTLAYIGCQCIVLDYGDEFGELVFWENVYRWSKVKK